MKFARIVFRIAGIWGIVVLAPLFFLVDVTGRHYEAPANYPHFFYGFIWVAMVWQFAFLLISSDPVRYRPLMIAAFLEKVGFVSTVIALYARGRIPFADTSPAAPDLLLGALFLVAFAKTSPRDGRIVTSRI